MPTAVLTGGSRGLGFALAAALADDDWTIVMDARDPDGLAQAAATLGRRTHAVPGDVRDPGHRAELARVAAACGGVDLVMNNASTLGGSPQPALDNLDADRFAEVLAVNLVAPLAVYQAVRPWLRDGATIINITSDASVEPYAGWGAYGASKAGLDHLTAILAAERPDLNVYAVDPGDMRTGMHQDAFPGEDISDRPLPEVIVPAFLRLLHERPPSGRLRAHDLLAGARA